MEELKDKKIIILGFGREGQDTFFFLRKLWPKKKLALADKLDLEKLDKKAREIIKKEKKKSFLKLYLGKNYLKALKKYDIVIKSPGVPAHLPEIEKAFKEKKVTSQLELFLDNFKGKMIGITGTKGKSTAAFLVYQLLKKYGLKVKLAGNIGKPMLSLLEKAKSGDIFVCELSSHQLYRLKKSPQIAVLLNIYPEHLDYYKNLKEYIKAKSNIAIHQKKGDYLIYNPKDKKIKEIARKSKAKKIALIESGKSVEQLKKIADISFGPQVLGLLIAVAKIFKIPFALVEKTVKEAKPLPHRLECLGIFKGIKFYNDSLSTIPESTIRAIDVLGKDVETIFLGGFDRGLSFKKLAKKIAKSKIKNLIFLPQSGERIFKEIKKVYPEKKFKELKIFFVKNLKDGVGLAFSRTKKGKICLLSCASPSFGLFKNYEERGNLFKKYIKAYGKK